MEHKEVGIRARSTLRALGRPLTGVDADLALPILEGLASTVVVSLRASDRIPESPMTCLTFVGHPATIWALLTPQKSHQKCRSIFQPLKASSAA